MLAALIAGERDPKALAQLAAPACAPRGLLEEAFTGHLSDRHAFLLATMLGRIDQAGADIAELDRTIDEAVAPFVQAANRLDEICGVGRLAAQVIAEVGPTWAASPPRATWAKFAPGVKQSAGKPKARPPPGTATATWPRCWARPPWSPAGPIPFGRALPPHRPAPRYQEGDRRSRPLHLVIVRHLLADPTDRFHDLGSGFYGTGSNPERTKRNHVRQLETLGYMVTLEPAA
jgi:transposase